jgi:hypothetical protein
MHNQKQLNHLKSLPEERLLEYISNQSIEKLIALKTDINNYALVENGISKDDRDKFLSILSYVEAKINGIKQTQVGNSSSEVIEEMLDISQFKPLKSPELLEILGLTIKKDNENKLITFLCLLSAYTQDSQFNISFNAPSSSGKSYIPTEIANLFPKEDVFEVGYCSPTAFFHDKSKEYKKESNELIVDFTGKIIIFLDQPHTLLLQHLRPILSHDKKEIHLKITDKSQKGGLRTKNITIKGFPSVIFCTAGLTVDEQESTRFILLSPEINQEKIREAVVERIKRSIDSFSYQYFLETNILRKQLKDRIRAIKQEEIPEIIIKDKEKIEQMFFERVKMLKPRHQRDIGRVISLIKVFALLNLWFREREGSSVLVNQEDIQEGFKLYDAISESQEMNLPPYIYDLYKRVILPAYQDRNPDLVDIGAQGITRQELLKKHYEVFGRHIPLWQLRQDIIPMLETAGLITQEPDQNNRRVYLIYPTTSLTILKDKQYSEPNGGVITEGDDIK